MTQVFVVAIIFGAIYKVIELFVRRRERIMLIDKITPGEIGHIDFNKLMNSTSVNSDSRFTAIKWGLFVIGLGLGFVVSTMVNSLSPEVFDSWRLRDSLNIGCILVFGGLGLVAAFLIEMKIRKSEHKSHEE